MWKMYFLSSMHYLDFDGGDEKRFGGPGESFFGKSTAQVFNPIIF